MADEEAFKEWLKQRRKALDLTQAELAHKVGCSIYTVQRIEEGVARPSRQLAELLAAGLELAPEERADFVKRARSATLRSTAAVTTGQTALPAANGGAGFPAPASANPYKGLRAFQEADAPDFFGREALVDGLRGRMVEQTELSRFLAVVGPSGAGKSSVVRAGLIPALRQQPLDGAGQPVVATLFPGTHPFEELEAALLRADGRGAAPPPVGLLDQLRADERGLARAVKRLLPGDDGEVLLLIDQFEELFTLVPDEGVRAAFIDRIFSAVADARSRLRVVITLRADFYDRPLLYLPSSELFGRRSEVIGPLGADEMYHAITGPAERHGLQLESGLVAAIMQDVAEQPGSLPLLEYALTELYERRAGRLLTLAAYRASGGVSGALAQRAASLYAGLSGAEQQEARQLFLRLVALGEDGEDTRRRVPLAEVLSAARDEAVLRRVLDLYGRYRLLTFDRDPLSHGATVEVAHEALLRGWEGLRGWLSESRERLRTERRLLVAAAEWQAAGQETSFLASGTRLAQFAELGQEGDQAAEVALTAGEQAYLAASLGEQQRVAAAEQERRTRELALQRRAANRLRYLVSGLAIFLLVALALAGWALNRSQVAQDNLAHADALRLASEANNLLLAHGDTQLIGLLAIRAVRAEYSPQGDAVLEGAALLGAAPREFIGHTSYLQGVAFSPDGRWLATTSDDHTARLWDVATTKEVRRFTGHTAKVDSVAFSPDGKFIVTSADDHTARLWEVATGQQVMLFSGHSAEVYFVAYAHDGKHVATTSEDGTARLWDVAAGQTVQTFNPNSGPVYTVAFSPDDKYLLTGGADGIARLWEAATGSQLRAFSGHTQLIDYVAFSPDGRNVATGSFDFTARLWDVASAQTVGTFSGHQDGVNAVVFTPDGRYLLTASGDKTLRLWDIASGQTVHVFSGSRANVNGADISADGKYVAAGIGDETARIWPLQTAAGETQFVGHTAAVYSALFSPDGKYVLTASRDKTARLWDAPTGEGLRTFSGHTDEVHRAVFSPDGKYVVTASSDKTARLWDATTSQELLPFNGHTDGLNRVAFSPDARYIVTTSNDRTARSWDAHTGKPLAIFSGHAPGQVAGVAFAPDGRAVVTGGDDNTARMWDPLTGKELLVFRGHTNTISGIAFSPDGKTLLTASPDGTAILWDVTTGKLLRRFATHPGGAYTAAFSPDGKDLLTGGADNTARLWDAQSGQELRRYSGHTGAVRSAVFSSDGKYVLTASADGTARLWHTDYHDTISYVCGLLARDLSPDERTQYGIIDPGPTCPAP